MTKEVLGTYANREGLNQSVHSPTLVSAFNDHWFILVDLEADNKALIGFGI